eukprot:5353573-Pleurochrysis_carterae.AAC.1
MSGRVCVEQYSNAPTSDWYARRRSSSTTRSLLVQSAVSTRTGRSSAAGAWSDAFGVGGDVDVEQVGDESLVFEFQRFARSEGEEIINVAPKYQALLGAVDVSGDREYAWVGGA